MHRCQAFGCSNPRSCKCRKKVTFPIICVTGGTASGKTTLSDKIVQNYEYEYINVGDLLEKEILSGSPRGNAIAAIVNSGEYAPDEDVMHLIEIAVNKRINKDCNGLILDGFPRTKYQGIQFETYITPITLILYLECSNETMAQRIHRRITPLDMKSDTENNNKIDTKFNEFRTNINEILSEFNNKTIIIDGEKSIDEIFNDIAHNLNEITPQNT